MLQAVPHMGERVEVFARITHADGDDLRLCQMAATDFGKHYTCGVFIYYHRQMVVWLGVENGIKREGNIVGEHKILRHYCNYCCLCI